MIRYKHLRLACRQKEGMVTCCSDNARSVCQTEQTFIFVADEYLQKWLSRLCAQHPRSLYPIPPWVGRQLLSSSSRGKRPLYIVETALALITKLIEEVVG